MFFNLCVQPPFTREPVTDRGKPCTYGVWRFVFNSISAVNKYQIKMYAEPSLPLTRKVARRRRVGRRESNKYQIFVISPSVIFQKKNDSSLVRGSLCLQMRLGAPHKIGRYNQIHFILYRRGELCSPAFNVSINLTGDRRSPLRYMICFSICAFSLPCVKGGAERM